MWSWLADFAFYCFSKNKRLKYGNAQMLHPVHPLRRSIYSLKIIACWIRYLVGKPSAIDVSQWHKSLIFSFESFKLLLILSLSVSTASNSVNTDTFLSVLMSTATEKKILSKRATRTVQKGQQWQMVDLLTVWSKGRQKLCKNWAFWC